MKNMEDINFLNVKQTPHGKGPALLLMSQFSTYQRFETAKPLSEKEVEKKRHINKVTGHWRHVTDKKNQVGG